MSTELANLEAQLLAKANTLYDASLDLNVAHNDFLENMKSLGAMRANVLKQYGIPVPPQLVMPPGSVSAGASADGAADGKVDWKGKLIQILSSRHKKIPAKDDLAFVTEPDPSGGFISTVSAGNADNVISQSYRGDAPAPSKKAAEGAAAKAVIAAEFPECLAAAAGAQVGYVAHTPAAVGAGAKAVPSDSKTKLMQLVQKLLGRPSTKTDIVYQTAGEPPSSFQCVLSLPTFDATAIFQSDPNGGTKKVAEMQAAEAALAHLSSFPVPPKPKKVKVV